MPIFSPMMPAPQLDELAAFPLMRGVRMQLHWHENPMYRFAPRPDLMNDERFRRNLAYLSDYDWSFDLQVFASQMADAAALAHDFPRTTFVLQHAGMLEDLSDDGRAQWREGMRLLAREPNIVSKMSGLGTFIHANDPDHIAAIYRDTVALFGASRCLFGSNFPIEKLWTTYPALDRSPQGSRRAIQRRRTARHFLEHRRARLSHRRVTAYKPPANSGERSCRASNAANCSKNSTP